MHSKSRKVACHRARAQRKSDKRRALRNAHRTRPVKAELRSANAMPARRQPRGLPKLVQGAIGRMVARHKLLTMPREGQKRDAA